MSERRRTKRACPYCGVTTEGAACPSHRELARLDAERTGAGPPLTEADLGVAELEAEPEPAPAQHGRRPVARRRRRD